MLCSLCFQFDATIARPSCQEPLQTYTLDAVYTEEALVMSSSIALPLAASSLAATLAIVEGLQIWILPSLGMGTLANNLVSDFF